MTAFSLVLALFTILLNGSSSAQSVPPAGYGQPSGEFDIMLSRVPVSDRAAAKALKPPFEPTPEILAEGKAIFLGRGTCFQCHGPEGKGDGGAAKVLPIQPRDFTNPKFAKVRTPGEMMWVLKNGSLGQTGQIPGTGMLPIVGQFLNEEDGWKVLLYERNLGAEKK
jgi:mono/diheme cytochrome c family protein